MRQGADRGPLKDRGHDLYETPVCAVRALVRTGCLNPYRVLYEPCAGRGAISRELKAGGWRVIACDLMAYDDQDDDIQTGVDFFKSFQVMYLQAIVTNPPFRRVDEFIRHGLRLGLPVIVLLRLMALEGAGRSDILQHLRHVYVGVERLPKFQRDNWKGNRLKTETAPFGWFVFEPRKRQGDIFTVSRISWREEDKNGRDIELGLSAYPLSLEGLFYDANRADRFRDEEAEG